MSLTDLFSPLRRHIVTFLLSFLLLGGGIYGLLQLIPDTQKTTLYFSLKPLAQEQNTPTFDHAESTMKMAEAIAGWAKNPQFREDVASEAGITISNFKRKLSARKQNYINVFWTLKLNNQERQHRDAVVAAITNQINQRFTTLNEGSSAPYAMTRVEVFSENQVIPWWWLAVFASVLGFGLSLVLTYLWETVQGYASFNREIETIFPQAALLTISEKLGQHDEALLERFILTFESPRLVGTFPASEKHFSLAPREAIDYSTDTPILLVQLGKTKLEELKNLHAIFGDEVGLVVFHK